MFRLCAKIEINGDRSWSLDFVTAVEITRDTEKLTAEAKIILPKKMKWDGSVEIPVKRGDRVRISLGYDDRLQLAFVGFVRDVGFKTPVVITCEDDMFRLKQMPAVKKAYRSVTLETLLKDQGITYRLNIMGEQSLGAYRVTADTVASLLGKLSEQGIRSFFRYEGGVPVLYCGVLFERDPTPSQVFRTGLNIISDQSLRLQKAENMRLRVKAVSLMPDNKKSRWRSATATASTERCTPTTKPKASSRHGLSRKSNASNATDSPALLPLSAISSLTPSTPSA